MKKSGFFLPALAAVALWAGAFSGPARAAEYRVGPGETYAEVVDAPWASLGPGDTVLIHWRATPYVAKTVVAGLGTESAPIAVRGVPGPRPQAA